MSRPLAIARPRLHQRAPLPEQAAASICRLSLILDHVRQRGLAEIVVEVCFLPGPVLEGRSEAMQCGAVLAQTAQRDPARHWRQRPPACVDEYVFALTIECGHAIEH